MMPVGMDVLDASLSTYVGSLSSIGGDKEERDSYARRLESKESQPDDTRVAGADETCYRLEVCAWKKCKAFSV